mmetsp:Transcript_16123/g.30595  ORF Transcript_16123/g.30595 Transcript_16123/m.30595 type:complete len:158 (+) Transcript_16123:472-945(+)
MPGLVELGPTQNWSEEPKARSSHLVLMARKTLAWRAHMTLARRARKTPVAKAHRPQEPLEEFELQVLAKDNFDQEIVSLARSSLRRVRCSPFPAEGSSQGVSEWDFEPDGDCRVLGGVMKALEGEVWLELGVRCWCYCCSRGPRVVSELPQTGASRR